MMLKQPRHKTQWVQMLAYIEKESDNILWRQIDLEMGDTVPELIRATKIVISHRSAISFRSVIDPLNRSI